MKVTYELLDLDLIRVDDKVKDPYRGEGTITRVTRQPHGEINVERQINEPDASWTRYTLDFRKETRDQYGNTFPTSELYLTPGTERLVYLRIAKATEAAATAAIENVARLASALQGVK